MIKFKLSSYLRRILIPIYHFFRKKINGVNNSFLKKSIPQKLKVEIRGNNNQIKFEPDCFLGDITIFIYGKFNKVSKEYKSLITNN
jgi:hypothetical protein